MIGWGIAALVVIAVPAVAILVWVIREQQSARRRRRFLERHKERSVSGIRERVKREREDERLANADTQIFPAVPLDEVPTQPLPKVPPLPRRRRPYVNRPPTPWPRKKTAERPDQKLMQRILDRLERLE
ncbi:hypothetical protein [Amycolatopsis japonica]